LERRAGWDWPAPGAARRRGGIALRMCPKARRTRRAAARSGPAYVAARRLRPRDYWYWPLMPVAEPKGTGLSEKGPHWHDGIRTRDIQFSKLALCPAELRAGRPVVFDPRKTFDSETVWPERRLLRRSVARFRVGNPHQIG
jgi:hypothetical protein